jgi:hypothetical protein
MKLHYQVPHTSSRRSCHHIPNNLMNLVTFLYNDDFRASLICTRMNRSIRIIWNRNKLQNIVWIHARTGIECTPRRVHLTIKTVVLIVWCSRINIHWLISYLVKCINKGMEELCTTRTKHNMTICRIQITCLRMDFLNRVQQKWSQAILSWFLLIFHLKIKRLIDVTIHSLPIGTTQSTLLMLKLDNAL